MVIRSRKYVGILNFPLRIARFRTARTRDCIIADQFLGCFQRILAFGELHRQLRLLARGEEDAATEFRCGTASRDGCKVQHGHEDHDGRVLLADLGDARGGGPGAEQRDVDQVQHALGRVAVAVDDLVEQIVRVGLAADGGHAAVEVHALFAGGDVGLGVVGSDRIKRRFITCG